MDKYYKGVVYLMTNRLNDKKYVGQTIHFNERMRSHRYNSKQVIDKAVDKKQLKHMLNEAEMQYIKWFDSKCGHNGYNVTDGGEGTIGVDSVHKKIVLQYDINGTLLKEWGSLTEAAKFLDMDISAITQAAKSKRLANGYIWLYKNGDITIEDALENLSYKTKRVAVYDNNSCIETYRSISEAARVWGVNFSTIKRIINGGNSNKLHLKFKFV